MNADQNWKPPDRLGYSSMRDVRLTGQGAFLAVLAGLVIVGAFVLGVFLARTVRREQESQRLLAEQGITANAVITRLWRTGDKSEESRVAYRFEYQGSVYSTSVKVPHIKWRELKVGAPLVVRLVPSRPHISHPVDWSSRGLPVWFPYFMTALVAGIGAMLAVVIARQMRLLAEGRPAPGRVTGIRKDKNLVVLYEFQILNGSTFKGRAGVHKMPAVGEPLCVLYDPENPRRNALYPLALVRLG
jgi:hypothetical protein